MRHLRFVSRLGADPGAFRLTSSRPGSMCFWQAPSKFPVLFAAAAESPAGCRGRAIHGQRTFVIILLLEQIRAMRTGSRRHVSNDHVPIRYRNALTYFQGVVARLSIRLLIRLSETELGPELLPK